MKDLISIGIKDEGAAVARIAELEMLLAARGEDAECFQEEATAAKVYARGLKEALESLYPGLPPADAPCHNGICSQEDCGYCGRILKAKRALDASPHSQDAAEGLSHHGKISESDEDEVEGWKPDDMNDALVQIAELVGVDPEGVALDIIVDEVGVLADKAAPVAVVPKLRAAAVELRDWVAENPDDLEGVPKDIWDAFQVAIDATAPQEAPQCNCPIPTYLHDVGCPMFDPKVGNATTPAIVEGELRGEWLITQLGRPYYWRGDAHRGWTTFPSEAMRFTSEDKAHAAIASFSSSELPADRKVTAVRARSAERGDAK